MSEIKPSLDYASAGVNIQSGNKLVEMIKTISKSTYRPGVMGAIGGFGALFELPLAQYREPLVVASTDGVGTKLKLASNMNQHSTIGIDLVAMCVNDIVVCGAEPLFFLDYFATGKLDPNHAATVIQGIAEGCKLANCALIGGETAEMPGMYQNNDYDLAGFCVGIVEKSEIIDGSQIKPGDKLIALASSGPHSNGYSLIRKIISNAQVNLDDQFGNHSFGSMLMTPTRIYVKTILNIKSKIQLLGIAHITGGGITENLPRILPPHTQASVDLSSWVKPAIFQWMQEQANISKHEMLKTFNCGIGMIICVSSADVDKTLAELKKLNETAWVIGEINTGEQSVVYIN
ncbi:MAG: phosphoribosylformylglycinamidine cyclo-ligase [Gammaproteobacteria bacterium]